MDIINKDSDSDLQKGVHDNFVYYMVILTEYNLNICYQGIDPISRMCQALSYHFPHHVCTPQSPLLGRQGPCVIHLSVLNFASNAEHRVGAHQTLA